MKQQSRRINTLSVLLILLSHFGSYYVDAWGTLGHEIVGNLAWYHLSPQAKSWVNETLKLSTTTTTTDNHHDVDPTMTPLGRVADWADQVRHYLGWSAPLHFIDVRDDLIPGGCVSTVTTEDCQFQYERDCVNDVCAAGAILNYTKQLMMQPISSSSSPSGHQSSSLRRERRAPHDKAYNLTQALMFLTHFIGDIHQPLHASRKSDKGGNDFHVHFSIPDDTNSISKPDLLSSALPVVDKKSHHHSWNLHSVWDTAMIEVVLGRNYNHSRHLMEQDLFRSPLYNTAILEKSSSPSSSAYCNVGVNATCVVGWGKESFALALKYAYVESDNVTQVSNGSTLDELYYESRLPIIKQQLILGGIRLAETIEVIVAANKNNKTPKKESSTFIAAPTKLLEVWKTLGLSTLR